MQERQLYLATLRALKDTAVQQHFPSWDEFSPVAAFDLLKRAILSSNLSELAKVDQLLSLAQLAQQRSDYTKTNQAFITARNVASNWVENVKKTELAPAA
jgi:hypothetical protein